MRRSIILTAHLAVDVFKIAYHFPEFRYRGVIPQTSFEQATTSEYILNDKDIERTVFLKPKDERCVFLAFDNKCIDGFGTVFTDYEPEELAVLLSRLPSQLFDVLAQAFAGTCLQLPKLSDEQQHSVQKQLDTPKPMDFSFNNTLFYVLTRISKDEKQSNIEPNRISNTNRP